MVVIGHTEDALPAAYKRCYVIHADITECDEEGAVLCHEKFTSLCYAGHLPGFCMSVNQHGFVYTMNVLEPLRVHTDKTPRHFLTRALLSARNLDETKLILRDIGTGSSDGFCVNMAFIYEEGPIVFHSAEIGPAKNDESEMSMLTISPGESHARCNKFLRLKIDETVGGSTVLSSISRHEVMDRIEILTAEDVINTLSNQDDPDFPIYRCGTEKDIDVTIATGIFDFKCREWRMYCDKANASTPIAIFSMELP